MHEIYEKTSGRETGRRKDEGRNMKAWLCMTYENNLWLNRSEIAREKKQWCYRPKKLWLISPTVFRLLRVCVFLLIYTYFKININAPQVLCLQVITLLTFHNVWMRAVFNSVTLLRIRDLEIGPVNSQLFCFVCEMKSNSILAGYLQQLEGLIARTIYGDRSVGKSDKIALLFRDIWKGEQVPKCARNICSYYSYKIINWQVLCETRRFLSIGR